MQAEWKTFLQNHGAEFDGQDTVLSFGSPQRECSLALSGTVMADLSQLGILAVHGADAETFLQGQFTNDIRHLDMAHSQLNGYCSPKGRLLATFRIFRSDAAYMLCMPNAMLESVRKRLQMFIMRSAVTLEPASERSLHIGVSGENAQAALESMVHTLPADVDGVTQSGEFTVLRIPGIAPRFELFAPLSAMEKLWETLAANAAPVGTAAWELLDIQTGLPSIVAETADAFVPQMINFGLIGGVNFKKGCYTGQEVVARMQYLGKLKRQMYLARIPTGHPPQPGDDVFSANDTAQSTGKIVNAQPHPDGGYAVLAVIQIGNREAGAVHYRAADGPELIFSALPYALADGE